MRTLRMLMILCLLPLLVLAGCGTKTEAPSSAAEEPSSSAGAPSSPAAAETIPIETVTVDGFSMNYFKFGQGDKTFVILPGLSVQGVMGSAQQVAEAYQEMADEFTIYVFDPRNELPDTYLVSEMAEDTAAVFQALGLDHVYVMGASMGGMVAMEIAVHHPQLIEKMVPASASVHMTDAQFQTLDNWIRLAKEGDAEALYLAFGEAIYPKDVFEQSRELLINAAKTVTEEDLKRFVILAESMRGFDMRNELDQIQCPVLAIGDKEDHLLGAEAIESMDELLKERPNCEIYIYDGYGHAVYDLAPDFKERMLNFFHIQ